MAALSTLQQAEDQPPTAHDLPRLSPMLVPAMQNYAVIPEMPLYFNVGKLLFGGRSGKLWQASL